MANNFYSSPTYINPNYSNDDKVEVQAEVSNNTQPLKQDNNVNIDALVKSYIEKDKEKTDNLTKQRDIINEQYNVNKKLEEELSQLRKQNEELKLKINSDEQYSKLEFLENTVRSLQEDKIKAQFVPIQNLFEEFGIKGDTGFKDTINLVKERYNLDLVKNPNVDLARFALSQIYAQQEVNTVPSGGYSFSANDVQALEAQRQEELYQQKLNERVEMLKKQYQK